MPEAPTQTVLLSVKELADRLRLSTKTVYAMARAGEIPGHRREGKRTHWRFELPAVLDALKHRKG